jgi:hypothetical protein
MDDTELFNNTSDADDLGIVRNHKTRLIKYTDKKDNFLWWSIDVTSTIDYEKSSPNGVAYFHKLCEFGQVLTAESGVFDYTLNGDFFQLTDDQKSRALTKKIPKPVPIGSAE